MITAQEQRKYRRKLYDWKRGRYALDGGSRWYPIRFDGDRAIITVHKIFQKANLADRDYEVIVDKDIHDRLKSEGRRLYIHPYIGGKWHRHDNVLRVVVSMPEENTDNNWALSWYVLGKRPEKGFMADHINGNDLDNRKENLRWATHEQNMQNRPGWNKYSSHAGVALNKATGKWIATVQRSFNTREQAEAYAMKLHSLAFGDYARKVEPTGSLFEN